MDTPALSPIARSASGTDSTPPTSISSSPGPSSLLCSQCGGSLTFPTTISNAHADLSSLVSNINDALKKSETKQKYASASALLLSWDIDEKEWDKEIADLEACFHGDFEFEVVQKKIPLDPPGEEPEDALESIILEFKRLNGRRDKLLIVYYSGHGTVDNEGNSIWAAKSSPELNWSLVQPRLVERYIVDVLLLLECCHAGAAAKSRRRDTKEILAACRAGGITYVWGDITFMKKLIVPLKRLRIAFGQAGFTVEELRCEMQKHLKIPPPHTTIMGSHPIQIRPFGVIESDANENLPIEPIQTQEFTYRAA